MKRFIVTARLTVHPFSPFGPVCSDRDIEVMAQDAEEARNNVFYMLRGQYKIINVKEGN